MRLTQWTDYSLRVLMYCGVHQDRPEPVTIAEIAQAHGISRSHLMKIVMTLSTLGLLETTRGRGGGLRLMKPADQIVLGQVIRQTETDLTLVECFDRSTNTCRLQGRCRLERALHDAIGRYFEVLDGLTLADLVAPAPFAPRGKAPAPPGTARRTVHAVRKAPAPSRR
ncbi:MAG TPA: Rrf2 family transcriptional regulator [Burkholderiaceae bacterium]|nr:Rrf2 family transcriptional regulator [Burkholderiaceae bacterium]